MTPKKKAEEIYFKMMEHSFGGDSEQSKQCALIAIDEILALLPEIAFGANVYEYWQQVRKEIEQL